MPRVIAEFADRRIVRANPRRDTTLTLEKKGAVNAMGEQQWISLISCDEYPDGRGSEEDMDVIHLMRYVSKAVPKAGEDK